MMRLFAKIKSNEKNKLLFWSLLGPVFLLISLLLASLDVNFFRFDLWFIVILGILLCFLFKKEGLWICISMLLISAVFKHMQISSSHFWQIGLEGSVALGFVITSLGFEYLNEIVHSFEERSRSFLDNISLMEEEMKNEGKYYQDKIKDLNLSIDKLNASVSEKEDVIISYSSFIEALRKNENQNLEDRKQFTQKALEKEKKISALNLHVKDLEEKLSHLSKENCIEKENKELLNELNQARKEKQQNHYINEALAFLVAKKSKKQISEKMQDQKDHINKNENQKIILDEKEKLFQMMEEKNQKLKSTEVLYKQLRKQFQERKIVLHQTRSSLFHTQEKLLSKEKEEDLQSYDISEEENILFHDLIKYEDEIIQYEMEIQGLYDVILAISKNK